MESNTYSQVTINILFEHISIWGDVLCFGCSYHFCSDILQHEEKLLNLEGVEISPGDTKIGPKSALKALGTNNPAAIVTTGEVAASTPAEGGKYLIWLKKHIGMVKEKGHLKSAFYLYTVFI